MANIGDSKIKYVTGGGQSYNTAAFTFAAITGTYKVITDPAASFLYVNGVYTSLNAAGTGAIKIDRANRHWQFKAAVSLSLDEGAGFSIYQMALHLDGVLMPESVTRVAAPDAAAALLIFQPVCASTAFFLARNAVIDLRIRRSAGTGASAGIKTMSLQAWMD